MVWMRNSYTVLCGKDEGKTPLVTCRSRFEYNTKMDLKVICVYIWAGFIWLRTGTSGGLL
jgi:hypothetical protein